MLLGLYLNRYPWLSCRETDRMEREGPLMPQSECDLKSSHLIAALIEMENIVRADEELTPFLECKGRYIGLQ